MYIIYKKVINWIVTILFAWIDCHSFRMRSSSVRESITVSVTTWTIQKLKEIWIWKSLRQEGFCLYYLGSERTCRYTVYNFLYTLWNTSRATNPTNMSLQYNINYRSYMKIMFEYRSPRFARLKTDSYIEYQSPTKNF